MAPSVTSSSVPDLNHRTVSWWLIVLIAAGIIFIGTRFLVVPWTAAAAFGVPADGEAPVAYLWAKGSRDIVSGMLLLALLWTRASRRVVAAFVGVAALIPLADFINVYANAVPHNPLALGIHGGTAAGMLALAAFVKMRGHPAD